MVVTWWDVKLFENEKYCLKWYGVAKKKLLIVRDDEKQNLSERMQNLAAKSVNINPKASTEIGEENSMAERDSLVTTMKLQQQEFEQGHYKQGNDPATQNFKSNNRYIVLNDEANTQNSDPSFGRNTAINNDSISPEHGDIANNYTQLTDETIQGTKDSSSSATESRNQQLNDQDRTSTRNGDNSYDKSKSVLIIGDSIIKHIDPRKLSKKSVYKRSFPGKRIEEIHDEIDNIHLNVEPLHVIIHAGTNNLPSEGADSCTRKIQKLALKTRSKFQNSKIGISSLIHRDDINVTGKLSAVNDKVKEMANKDDFVFIDNSHIDGSCLNGSKLHLNAKGSAYLANNFIKFIRPLGKQSKQQTGFVNPIHQLGQLLTQLARQAMNISPHKKPRR